MLVPIRMGTSMVSPLACENIRFSTLFATRNVPGGEERGETDVFAGYVLVQISINFFIISL